MVKHCKRCGGKMDMNPIFTSMCSKCCEEIWT